MRKLILLAVLGLLVVGCGAKTADGKAIYMQDDFSNVDSGWARQTDSDGVLDYSGGAYRILVTTPNLSMWSAVEHGDQTDISIEVDATKVAGDDVNEFGLVCRYGITDTFYVGVVSSDGYYAIMEKTLIGDEFELLGAEEFLPSDAVVLGDATNHLRMDCVGTQISLYVNGQLVHQVTDDSLTEGYSGVFATSYDVGGTDILFDNFVVHQP
jgi:hypothetical protein